MTTFTKSTNAINNAFIGFIHPEYVGLATEIKYLGRRKAEINDNIYINGRQLENP
jgi:hypothetical protein